jgi:2'-5' RNA ligase
MQKKRLFIAIPLSGSVSRSVKRISAELEEKFKNLPNTSARFVPQENWHITVSFLGNEDDVMLPVIADAMKAAIRDFEPPEIAFEKVSYFPAHGDTVKMIWLSADRATSEVLGKIRDAFQDELAARGVPFQGEMRAFAGHITLAKFTGETARAAIPAIERPLQFNFPAASLDLMESELARSGAEYNLLQSFPFKE